MTTCEFPSPPGDDRSAASGGAAVWPMTSDRNAHGALCVGGVSLVDIADGYGTPAFVIDEADFRSRIRNYRRALPAAEIFYAGKALLTVAIARWAASEHIGIDVCSDGELAVALAAGVHLEHIILHGNAKSYGELRRAVAAGVGRIVVDSLTDIEHLGNLARQAPAPLHLLVRVTPGIDIGGHSAVTTGITDQKFGFPLHSSNLVQAVELIQSDPGLKLIALHCHIGSQVTDARLYGETIQRTIAVMADIRERHGVVLDELNIGGGHAVPYLASDRELTPADLARVVNGALSTACTDMNFPLPRLALEPGRAISARAGVTVYRVISVKTQPGARTFVAVDGGMSDNPRVELYDAKYTVTLANRVPSGPFRAVTIAGRHCESGDEIARDVELPADLRPGDVLAVACTGAYHHNMASNYNAVGRPPLIGVDRGRATELVRRETPTDLLGRDQQWNQSSPGWVSLLHGE